nr:MAG TPA: virion morphogenesis protein [Caudoviricetes sp.]
MSSVVAAITKQSETHKLNDSLKKLKKTMVLVGIAKGSTGDAREDGGPDNHLLGFVHEYGSPAAGIPPRPFLRPGVNSAREQIASGLEEALKAALRDDADGMQAALDMTGIQAVSAVKSFMRDPSPPFVELKPATLRNRHRSRMTKTKRENEVLNESVKPLLNTGALRNAIDYYIED